MAFRLRPLHEDKLHFADLSNTQILILALEASQKLEWNIEGIALREVIFYVPMDMRSQGEEVTFTIEEGNSGEISVRSQCASVQLVDYGKNRKNIQKLQETMEEIKSTLTPEELAQKANEPGRRPHPPADGRRTEASGRKRKRVVFHPFLYPPEGIHRDTGSDRHQYPCLHTDGSYRSGNSGTFHTGLAKLGRRLRSAHPDR